MAGRKGMTEFLHHYGFWILAVGLWLFIFLSLSVNGESKWR